MKKVKKILAIVLGILFFTNNVLFASYSLQDTLAVQPASERPATQSEIGRIVTDGIGEGAPLACILKGELPPKLDSALVDKKVVDKIYRAIDGAIKQLERPESVFSSVDSSPFKSPFEEMREETIKALKEARGDLTRVSFFHAIFLGEHDFLYGYNRAAWAKRPEIGLAVEYIEALSVEALAEVLAHEFAPKDALLDYLNSYSKEGEELERARALHKMTYEQFQKPVFWASRKGKQNIVKKETNEFTEKLAERFPRVDFSAKALITEMPDIGERPVVRLRRHIAGETETAFPDVQKPEVVSVLVAPGAGMNTLSIKALLPGKKEPVELLYTTPPGPNRDKTIFEMNQEEINEIFSTNSAEPIMDPIVVGGAVINMCNRYDGHIVEKDGKIYVEITFPNGQKVLAPANFKRTSEDDCHLHGTYHAQKQDILLQNTVGEASITGKRLVRGRTDEWPWPSNSRIITKTSIRPDGSIHVRVTQNNIGDETTWTNWTYHPCFLIRKDERAKVRVHIPGKNYTPITATKDGKPDVAQCIPTGEIKQVKKTIYDFTKPEGRLLSDIFYDDSFRELMRQADGSVIVEVIYPESGYKMRIRANDSRRNNDGTTDRGMLRSVHIFAPTSEAWGKKNGSTLIGLEPAAHQGTNPIHPVWKIEDSGLIELKPGEEYTYDYTLEVLPLDENEVPWAEEPRETKIQKAKIDEITGLTAEIQSAASVVSALAKEHSNEASHNVVILQKSVIEKSIECMKRATLRKAQHEKASELYKRMIQNLKKTIKGKVIEISSDVADDVADEIHRQLEKGGMNVIAITESVLAEALNGKIRASSERYKVMGIDLAESLEEEQVMQYINLNYIALMGLAALNKNSDLFSRAYKIVTGHELAREDISGEMAKAFIYILPKIVTASSEINLYDALKKLFDVSA